MLSKTMKEQILKKAFNVLEECSQEALQDYEFVEYINKLWNSPNKNLNSNAIAAFRHSQMKPTKFREVAKDLGIYDESMETFLY